MRRLLAARAPRSIARRRLLMADAPDCPAAVFGNEQRPISGDCHADGPTPDTGVGDDEPGHEVLVFTGRLPGAVEQKADNLIAGPLRTVPGPVQRHEGASLVGGRKVLAFIKDDLKRRGVSL